MMQMSQFLFNFMQAIYCRSFSKYPRFLSELLLWYMLTLLALFGHFFYKKHMAPKSKGKKND